MTTYSAVRETIERLIDYPLDEWRITRISAETCFEALDKYEKEGRPAPLLFVEDEGVTLTWTTGDWKIYQHFLSETKESEFYCFWRKSA